jgi:AcrR family transcriptional regulator
VAADVSLPAERPLRADARRNQEKLVAVAREAFTDHGIDAPLDDIARRAGVGPGTLYRHFPTREALLAAVYISDIETLSARADEFRATLPPIEALTAWINEQMDYIGHKRGLGAAIKSMLGTNSEIMDYCRDTLRGAVGRLLEPAQADGFIRTDIDSATLLRLIHGVGVASESQPDKGALMLSVVLAGLRPSVA